MAQIYFPGIDMTPRLNRAAGLAFLLTGMILSCSVARAAEPPQYVKGKVLVKFRQLPTTMDTQGAFAAKMSVLSGDQQNLLSKYKVTGLKRVFGDIPAPTTAKFSLQANSVVAVPNLYTWCVLTVSSSTDIEALAAQLKQEPSVETAEPNYLSQLFEVTPDDTQFAAQWHHKNTGQTGGTLGADIKSSFVWTSTTGTSGLKIAILDTGINTAHEDLTAVVIAGTNTLVGSSDVEDTNGHGTHVAGIVAASGNNAKGVVGVMWRASLMPVRVCDSSCPDDAIAAGLHWAADNGARIINLSLGGTANTAVLRDAVAYAVGLGVVVVAAAGNDGDETINYPCAYTNVICVAATDLDDKIASFSTRGSWITIAAPGKDILSTVPTGVCDHCAASGYGTLSGTSMASPMVAGVAGLILSANPTFTRAQVSSKLTSTVDNIDALNPLYVGKFGAGRVNALQALSVRPRVLSFALAPDAATIANGQTINYTMTISSDFAPPAVTVRLVNQFNQVLTSGTAITTNIVGQLNVSGSIQTGALATNYPTTSQVRLRVELNDTIYDVFEFQKTWSMGETASIPAGGTAAVWNGLFDPNKNQKSTVRLTLTQAGRVLIRVFRRDGRLIKVLADQDAGTGVHTWSWDGTNDTGGVASSGLYLVRITGPGIDTLKKVLLVK
jgi:thermitase